MHPEHYQFIAPIEIPTIIGSCRGGFLDVVPDDGDSYRLLWRSLEDWPLVIRHSTGERARLVRTCTNDVHTLPRLGKVTLTFEQCIVPEDGIEPCQIWDESDWRVQG